MSAVKYSFEVVSVNTVGNIDTQSINIRSEIFHMKFQNMLKKFHINIEWPSLHVLVNTDVYVDIVVSFSVVTTLFECSRIFLMWKKYSNKIN